MTEPPIRVGVDLTPVLPGAENGGSKFATLQFLEGLLQGFEDRIQLTLFISDIASAELHSRFAGRAKLICTKGGQRRTDALAGAVQEIRSQRRIRKFCREHSIQVLYSAFGRFLSVAWDLPIVAQVQDLIHLDYPATLTRKDRLWRHLNLLKLKLRGAWFQVPSEFTRHRLHTAYSISLDSIYRTYLPIQHRLERGHARQGADRYFFYPARAWPHKNHKNLLRAYKIYCETLGDRAWGLALTGGKDAGGTGLNSQTPRNRPKGSVGSRFPPEARQAGRDRLRPRMAGLKVAKREPTLPGARGDGSGRVAFPTRPPDIEFLGEITDEEVSRTYQTASALIFPSRYEGFGIPLIEAMHFGLPIICGRAGSQAEVAGEAALYIDVENPQEIAQAMVRVTEDNALRRQLVENGRQQLARFDWDAEVAKLANVFERCSAGCSSHGIGCVGNAPLPGWVSDAPVPKGIGRGAFATRPAVAPNQSCQRLTRFARAWKSLVVLFLDSLYSGYSLWAAASRRLRRDLG